MPLLAKPLTFSPRKPKKLRRWSYERSHWTRWEPRDDGIFCFQSGAETDHHLPTPPKTITAGSPENGGPLQEEIPFEKPSFSGFRGLVYLLVKVWAGLSQVLECSPPGKHIQSCCGLRCRTPIVTDGITFLNWCNRSGAVEICWNVEIPSLVPVVCRSTLSPFQPRPCLTEDLSGANVGAILQKPLRMTWEHHE